MQIPSQHAFGATARSWASNYMLSVLLSLFLFGSAGASTPIQLFAPWDVGQTWQPSTYTGHGNAIDFNKVTNVRPTCQYADSVGNADEGENIRAAHAGTVLDFNTQGNPHPTAGYWVTIRSLEDPAYKTFYCHFNQSVEQVSVPCCCVTIGERLFAGS